MDLSMSIASLSVAQSMANIQQQVSVAMLDKTMEQSSANLLNMVNDFQQANGTAKVVPYTDRLLDTYA